jgi:gliding motility associated protien GldN
MRFARLILLTVILTAIGGLNHVDAQNKILDKPWIKENTPTRRVVPYTHVREADVMWHRRIWRSIDLREKINHPLYYPTTPINDRKSLYDVISDAVRNGELDAYDPIDDEFTVKLTGSQAEARMGDTLVIMLEDDYGDPTIPSSTYSQVESVDIVKYYLKEDWFFDNERSIMDVRIIGLCPFRVEMDENGDYKGIKPIYWIYFPEARYIFANYDVFNRENEAERRTFEDIFWKRLFNSYVIKRSNVYDRFSAEYLTGIDLLLEADRIKDDIFNMEHDLWHF